MDGVRRALSALGQDATPTQIRSFLRDEFGLEMSLEHISNYKGKVLRKGGGKAAAPAAAAKATNPGGEGGPPAAPGGNAAGKPEALTKGEAVRRALRQLGNQAPRAEIQSFVKDNFGIEVSLDHISTTRVEALRKKKSAKKPAAAKAAGPKPEAKPKAAAAPAAPPARAVAGAAQSGIALDDLVALKELVGRVGPDHLRKLIDVLNR
jgi:hypothetical protein